MVFNRCWAPGCTTKCGQGLILRGVPLKGELRIKWLSSLPLCTKITFSLAICELHFERSQFETVRADGKKKKKLKANAVPSVWRSVNNENDNPPKELPFPPQQLPFPPQQLPFPPKQLPFREVTNTIQHPSQTRKNKMDHSYSSSSKRLSTKGMRQHSQQTALVKGFMTLSTLLSMGSFLAKPTPPSLDTNIVYLPSSELLHTEALSTYSVQNVGSNRCETGLVLQSSNPTVDQVLLTDTVSTPSAENDGSLSVETDLLFQSPNPTVDQVLLTETVTIPSVENEESLRGESGLLLQSPNPTFDQDSRLAAMEEIVRKQSQEILRLRVEGEEKSKSIKLLERKLSTHFATVRKFNILRSTFDRLKKAHSDCGKSLTSRFPWLRGDQITALMRKSTRGLQWSVDTIRDGLVFKSLCGTTGFSRLVKQVPIFPSVRSLQSHVQFVQLSCGILYDVLNLMAAAVRGFCEFEKDCHLMLDELAIQPGVRMDFSLKKWVGSATLPSHVGTAKKGLVFLLAGVSRRWKQVVACHLTNSQPEDANKKDNATGKAMASIIDDIVIKSEEIGLHVNGATCDMGADNMAWWKVKGIKATREGPVTCSFPHPVRKGEQFYVLPDAPHLFKSIKKMLEVNGFILLPHDVVQQEGLPTDLVKYSHLEDLCNYENQFELKVAPGLKEDTLHCHEHFSTMNVSTSRAVLNNRTGAGLKKLSEVKQDPSYHTTAWFVLILNDFFKIVTSRTPKIALSKRDPTAYNKAINILKKVSHLFRHMRVGEKGHWKPSQKGVLILVESVLGLQKYYLEKKKYIFLLLGHFTQDCLENLFSCIRLRQAVPHAVAFLQILKVLSLAMYSTFVKGSNYDYDDSSFMVDALSQAKGKAAQRAAERAARAQAEETFKPVPQITAEDLESIPDWERSVIYDMAGSVLRSLQVTSNTLCSTCLRAVLWKGKDPHPYSDVTALKEFVGITGKKKCNNGSDSSQESESVKCQETEASQSSVKKGQKSIEKGGGESSDDWYQIQVSHECFVVILIAEVTFRKIRTMTTRFNNTNVLQYLLDGLMYVWEGSAVPDCHDIKRKILQFYLRSRIKQYGMKRCAEEKKKEKKKIDKSSKSIAMRQTVRQL